jgi:hypothetical protein
MAGRGLKRLTAHSPIPEEIFVRRTLALAIVVSLLSMNVSGCSSPIDTGSSIPAQSQPIYTLLALVGLGFAITAFHHHSEQPHSGSGRIPQTPISVIPLRLTNQVPVDLTLDPNFTGSFGVLLAGNSGGAWLVDLGDITTNNNVTVQYALPVGYQPTALTIDANVSLDHEWFVDASGTVEGCANPGVGGPTTCTPSPAPFSDTLGTCGTRYISADATHIFIACDSGAGTVAWVAFDFNANKTGSGSYTYTAGPAKGLYTTDAVFANGQAISQFLLFHKDGTSHEVVLTTPPTTGAGPTLNPIPLDIGNAAITGVDIYAYNGAPTSGSYSIARYGSSSGGLNFTIQSLLLVAENGVPNPGPSRTFGVPLTSLHADSSGVYGLDPTGTLVVFRVF